MGAQRLWLPLLFTIVLGSAGCISSTLEPVEIYPEDMCSRCKMAISDKRFAGEIVVEAGVARKFDDLGCLLADIRDRTTRDEPPAFAVDFEKREWVNVKEAYFLRSSAISTPMASGLVAFKDRSDAERAAARYDAKVSSYADVMKSMAHR
ncbi:MAG: nitrous oxide reductase accessory protein NosL [Acidobacteriota bacterium]